MDDLEIKHLVESARRVPLDALTWAKAVTWVYDFHGRNLTVFAEVIGWTPTEAADHVARAYRIIEGDNDGRH